MTPLDHNILVVDDDEASRYFKAHILAKRGYTVREAAFAAEALRILDSDQPAVVLLDVKLPDGNGIELGGQIKAKRPGTIVLQTSAAFTADRHRIAGLAAGADAYLVEPIEPEELLATVDSLLRLHRAEQELRALNQALEERVAERTRELVAANHRLAAENEQRIRLEQILRQAEKLDAVGQLTGSVAHDFNNFLSVVLGNLDLAQQELAKGPAPSLEKVGRLVAAGRRGAEDCERLTRQLLAFARRDVPRLEVVRPDDVIVRFEGILRRALGEGVELALSLAARGRCRIDVGQFEAALLNLAVNARDAMPRGGVLRLRTGDIEIDSAEDMTSGHDLVMLPAEPGRYVCIRVSDSGSGMTEDVLAHAFEPFFTTKAVGAGSGLGLSQVYDFVRQGGGLLTVDTAIDTGTTIAVYLPRSGQATAKAETVPVGEQVLGGSETILVVEDNAMLREFATTIIAELGYRVLAAGDAAAALGIIAGGEPVDLLFTDIVLPKRMTGIELAHEVRRLRPGLRVLMTTGYAGRNTAPPEGEFPVVAKPYRYAQLARRIRETLDTP